MNVVEAMFAVFYLCLLFSAGLNFSIKYVSNDSVLHTDVEKGMHEMNEYKKTIIDCVTSEFTKFLQLSVNMYLPL